MSLECLGHMKDSGFQLTTSSGDKYELTTDVVHPPVNAAEHNCHNMIEQPNFNCEHLYIESPFLCLLRITHSYGTLRSGFMSIQPYGP
jgi:hypothetical protein